MDKNTHNAILATQILLHIYILLNIILLQGEKGIEFQGNFYLLTLQLANYIRIVSLCTGILF